MSHYQAVAEVLAAHRQFQYIHIWLVLIPTISARNQSDAYAFSTGQSRVYKNSTGQSQACRFSTVGFGWWPVVVTAPTDTACTQATRRVWEGNPAFKTSKTKQLREKVFIETYVTDHGFHRNISVADKQCRHVWAWADQVHACEINK